MADDNKPVNSSSDSESTSSTDADNPIANMGIDELAERVKRGEIELPRQTVPPLEDLLTPENIDKFIMGEITWGQLQGVTMEQAYGLAEHGYQLFEKGRYHDARAMFEGLVMCNPHDPYFHNALGAVYQQLDMLEEALEQFSTAIELDEDYLHAFINRGELLLQNGDFDRALDDLRRAIELDPENKDPASARARALAMATAEALEKLAKIIEDAQ